MLVSAEGEDILVSADGKSTKVAVGRANCAGGVVHLVFGDEDIVGLNVLASNPVGSSTLSTSGTDGAATPIKLAAFSMYGVPSRWKTYWVYGYHFSSLNMMDGSDVGRDSMYSVISLISLSLL